MVQRDTKSKRKSKVPVGDTDSLPIGNFVVSDQFGIVEAPQPKQFSDEDEAEVPDVKGKVWYVLIIKAEYYPPEECRLPKITQTWIFAHTKSWARELARRARDEGHTIVDIFRGTKMEISHKFRGLK